MSRGRGDMGARVCCSSLGRAMHANDRLSSSPSGWPGCTSSEVIVATDRSHVDQECVGVASNASHHPFSSTPMTPRSFRLNQQTTPQHPQEIRDRSPQSQEPECRRQSLRSHSIKATQTEHVAESEMVRTPVMSSPLPAAAAPAATPPTGLPPCRMSLPSRFTSPLQSAGSHEAAVAAATAAVARTISAAKQRGSSPPLSLSSRASLPSRTSSPMHQLPHTQGMERPPDSVAAAAATAVAAAVAAATAAGFGNKWNGTSGGGLVQRSASLGPRRPSSAAAGARRRDLGCGMCGSLSSRGLASPGDAHARILKAQAPASPLLRKTLSSISARTSVSPSTLRITSSNVDARESCAGRISALKSELDLLKSKTGTMRQQLQRFKASQSSLLAHNTTEVAELREPRCNGGAPEG